MLRFLVKLALTAVLASAAWRLGAEYLTHHRFREAVRQATADHRSEAPLREAILDEADRYGVPMAEEDLSIEVDERRTVVQGRYVRVIEFLPGVRRPWTFAWTVETFSAPDLEAAPTSR